MTKILATFYAGACLLVGAMLTSGASLSQTSVAGEIFDAKALIEWTRTGDANWAGVDGVVQANAGNGFLVSRKQYSDFYLRAEVWVDDKANSGIFIRCQDAAKPNSKTGYEVNLFDERPDPAYGTGAIVDVAKVSPMPKAGGKWNVMEITAKGPQFTVVLNGLTTVDKVEDKRFPSGFIGLQYGAGVVKFRKIEIKPL
jgi:hypothetical protein